MNKKELVAKLAKEQGMKKQDAEKIVDAIFETIVEELKAGEMVKIPGFGNFVVKERKERIAVMPHRANKVLIPAYKTAGFKPAKTFREQVKK